jgi:hypothetical protein
LCGGAKDGRASRIVASIPGAKSIPGSAQHSEVALILSNRAFEAFAWSRAPPDTPCRLIPVASQHLNLHHTVMPQAPTANTPTEVLAGLVERVTFHNEENGFCVLRVKLAASAT